MQIILKAKYLRSPRRGCLSAAREGRRRRRRSSGRARAGRGPPGGGRPSCRRDREEASGCQGEALPHALGPPGAGAGADASAGAAGRGAEAPSISRPLPHSLSGSRSLFLPLAHTGTHPTSPVAAARPHALTCISLTSHLMAASGAGPALTGGSRGGEDVARDVPSAGCRAGERAGAGGGGHWKATPSGPGAAELTPRPRGRGMPPGLRDKAARAGERRLFPTTRATEDWCRCRSRWRYFRCLRAFGYFGVCVWLVAFSEGRRTQALGVAGLKMQGRGAEF